MVLGVGTLVSLWPTVRGNADVERLVEDLPATVRVLIGSQAAIPLSSAPGYLQARLFSTLLPILLVVYGIGLGGSAIGGAEEDGTLELIVTAPVTRRRVAVERFAASVVLLTVIAAVGLAATVGLGAAVGLFDDLSLARTFVATLAVAAFAFLHLALAFAVGAHTGRRGPAISVASAAVATGYVLHGLAASATAIERLRLVSPSWWLLDRNLLVQDPTFLALGLPVVLGVALATTAVWRFERRDLRFP